MGEGWPLSVTGVFEHFPKNRDFVQSWKACSDFDGILECINTSNEFTRKLRDKA